MVQDLQQQLKRCQDDLQRTLLETQIRYVSCLCYCLYQEIPYSPRMVLPPVKQASCSQAF